MSLAAGIPNGFNLKKEIECRVVYKTAANLD